MKPALIFDLDGTLVDTAPDLLEALNFALAREGRPPVDPEELRRLVGRGARVLISEAFKMAVGPADPGAAERMFSSFIEHYRDHIADQSRPFPGVVETLEAQKAEGARLGVLTNKPHDLTLKLLDALGLSPLFEAVYGQGRKPYFKPDPRIFEDIVAEMGGRGPGALMIGDSISDVEVARAAGAPVLLVSFGYTPEPARTLGADAVVDDFRDIPATARRLLEAATLP
jgi:phosphoglycolate phosphatase